VDTVIAHSDVGWVWSLHDVGIGRAGDQELLQLARAQLDAVTFSLLATGAGLAKVNGGAGGRGGLKIDKGKAKRPQLGASVSKCATAEVAQDAVGIVCECARLGLWEEAREVYERAVEAAGPGAWTSRPGSAVCEAQAALLQSEILARIRSAGCRERGK
jgi:hypothetical protein